VRLDSGDMVAGSRQVRAILDQAGFPKVNIYASGGFDEYKIAALLKAGAQIDAFGVGTRMGVSADAPFLDIIYKLARYGGRDVKKFSPGKISLAGRKQVFRKSSITGRPVADIIGTRHEIHPDTLMLLNPVMQAGCILEPHPALNHIRAQCEHNLAALDEAYKALDRPAIFPVQLSDHLAALQEQRVSPGKA
jgi:nicotinate phosphoribosyltransferase